MFFFSNFSLKSLQKNHIRLLSPWPVVGVLLDDPSSSDWAVSRFLRQQLQTVQHKEKGRCLICFIEHTATWEHDRKRLQTIWQRHSDRNGCIINHSQSGNHHTFIFFNHSQMSEQILERSIWGCLILRKVWVTSKAHLNYLSTLFWREEKSYWIFCQTLSLDLVCSKQFSLTHGSVYFCTVMITGAFLQLGNYILFYQTITTIWCRERDTPALL